MPDTGFAAHDLDSCPEQSRQILTDTRRSFGFLPSPMRYLADSPPLLRAFVTGNALFGGCSLAELEREVVVLTVATHNGCHYCVAMHTTMLTRADADADLVADLRAQRPLRRPRLEALRAFTLAVLAGAGRVEDAGLRAFLAAGYTTRNALDVVLGVGVYTLSTFANRLVDAPLDEPFRAAAWSGGVAGGDQRA